MILSGVLQGLILWLESLLINCYEYVSDTLLDVFQLDLDYFRSSLPVTDTILEVLWAAGWALLLGNLVFQAMKGMLSGLGFESEPPAILFGRTAVFAFLLAVCPQICELVMGLTGQVVDLLQIPDAVHVRFLQESDFHFPAAWLLAVIVDVILVYQLLRIFLSIAERYVLLVLLTICAPLAFGLGGSKQTEDLFKGWARLFAGVCGMTILNVVVLKLMLAGMADPPGDVMAIPWLLLMIGIGKVGKKSDELISRIGLNASRTGESIGRGMPGMMAMAAIRVLTKSAVPKPAREGNPGSRQGARAFGWPGKKPDAPVGEGASGHIAPSRPPLGRRGGQTPEASAPSASNGKRNGPAVPRQNRPKNQTDFYYADGSLAGTGTLLHDDIPERAEKGTAPARPPVGKSRGGSGTASSPISRREPSGKSPAARPPHARAMEHPPERNPDQQGQAAAPRPEPVSIPANHIHPQAGEAAKTETATPAARPPAAAPARNTLEHQTAVVRTEQASRLSAIHREEDGRMGKIASPRPPAPQAQTPEPPHPKRTQSATELSRISRTSTETTKREPVQHPSSKAERGTAASGFQPKAVSAFSHSGRAGAERYRPPMPSVSRETPRQANTPIVTGVKPANPVRRQTGEAPKPIWRQAEPPGTASREKPPREKPPARGRPSGGEKP